MKIPDKILYSKLWRWVVILLLANIFVLGVSQCKAQCPGTNTITGGNCTFYNITPVPSGQTGTECFSFQPETQIIHLDYMFAQGTACGAFQYSSLQVYIYNNTCDTLISFSNLFPTQTNIDVILDTNTIYQMCVRFTASCSLTAICPQYNLSYLPVELSVFSLESNIDEVKVYWETASEHNADYFILEKADSNFVFMPIYKAYASGNSTQINRYKYTDEYPRYGANYYRLKQFDYDGTCTEYPPQVTIINIIIPHSIWTRYDIIGRELK